ncbi:hypothetical protein ED733_001391 [Metarhizium rileyi]|uniref:Uncharacterized protein n=1 Tax=Metarhizium rileyi (strain RCEF 4871) TaxID=1649241 RepID=A0A5C6G6Q1_METRR|nr:hypothetical protein ED733_001391 [Metarhizium rileyi]
MPIRSLLTKAHTNETDVTEPQDAGNDATPKRKRGMGAGRGLAHLVSKFEVLEAMSCPKKPLSIRETPIAPVALSATRLIEPASASSSISSSSLRTSVIIPSKTTVLIHQDSEVFDDNVDLGWQPGKPETLQKSSSVVAERRKIFEVNLGPIQRETKQCTSPTYSPGCQGSKLRLPAKWQTVRARSPLACLAQSQAAVLSRPQIPNASKRLSGYLPLSSTCPSLQSAQRSARLHRLSDCMTHPSKEKDIDETTSSVSAAQEGYQIPRLPDSQLYRIAPNKSENISRAQAEPPSRPESQESIIAQSRKAKPVPPIKLRRTRGCKDNEAAQPQEPVESQAALSSNKVRSKLPLRQHIKRRPREYKPSPSHPPSPERLHNELSVGAAVAQLEATPKQPTTLPPSLIENTIGHFESLIAKDKVGVNCKYSVGQQKSRIPASASCLVAHQPKPGITEEARRKFSASWGPARWRQRHVQTIDTSHHATRNGLSSASERPEGHLMPTDGSVEVKRPLSENWDTWTELSNPSGQEIKRTSPRPKVSGSDHAVSNAQQADNDPAPTGSRTCHPEHTSNSTRIQSKEGRRSWRLSGRRWMSRSSTPFVARADCTLEQPRPVRVNEMKRIVSLCREKMMARKDRAQTD